MTSLAEPLTELLGRLNGAESPPLAQAVRALCLALAEGHVCVPLEKLGQDAELQLQFSRVVGAPGEFKPLIIDGGHLYLARYWQYESALAAQLLTRAAVETVPPDAVTLHKVKKLTIDAAQRRAITAILQRSLSIVTGGPGTGKTRTATIGLTLLAEHLGSTTPQIALAAPTGKAAARLSSAMAEAVARLDVQPAVREALAAPATTLHRLLGALPGEGRFRHHAGRPHPADVVVIDEASMIDLPLMTRLFDALRPEARLVLLGDRDQLASVDAGHVLGDMCAVRSGPLRKCVVELTTNYRFGEDSMIHRFAQLVKAGDLDGCLPLLEASAGELSATPLPRRMGEALRDPLVSGWKAIIEAESPAAALDRLNDFRVLCAVREGPQGVYAINQLCEQLLAAERLIHPTGSHYAGRPVLILRNDYQLRLFNGDMGIIRRNEDGQLRAYFPGEDGAARSIAPSRLPQHETAFAMTVHKSQGSEFTSVLVILPEIENPVLSRELLYTAITRARRHAHLWWTKPALSAALSRHVIRWSGLRSRLGFTVPAK